MTRTTRPVLFWIAAGAVLASFAASAVVRIVEPLGLDQGLFACVGQAIARGDLPYRDVWDSKPPGALYTYALAFALPGSLSTRLWVFESAVLLATCSSAFLLARRLWGRWAGLFAAFALALAMWAPGLGGYWARAQAEELLALPMLLAAWAAFACRTRSSLAFWAGVGVGICAAFKVPALLLGVGFAAGFFLRMPLPAALRCATLLVIGGSLAPAAFVGYYALHGALPELWGATVQYNLAYATVLHPAPAETLRGVVATLARTLPGLLLLAAFFLVTRWHDERDRVAWLLPWLLASILAVFLQGKLAGYHFLMAVPPLAIASAGATSALRFDLSKSGLQRILAASTSIVATALLVWMIVAASMSYSTDIAYLTGRLDRRAYLAQFQTGSISASVQMDLAAYVRQRSAPHESILVWGLAPGLYAEAERRPATRFPFHQFLLTDAPLSVAWPAVELRKRRFLARLGQQLPRIIIVGTLDSSIYEPRDSLSELHAFEELDRIVNDNYVLDRRFGTMLVYRGNW